MCIQIYYYDQLFGYDEEELTINFWNPYAIEDKTYGFETVTAFVETKLNGTEATIYPK